MSAPAKGYVPALAFHALTPLYDAVVGTTTRERRFKQALIAQAGVRPGHQVLDLASGTGTLAIWLQQRKPGAQVTGVDGDPAILAIARRKAARAGIAVHFDQGLSYDLPYPADQFDRVLSSLFLHHLSWTDKERTLREVWRVLKPGGELHVADWGRPASALMRTLFLSVQLLDGFANTRDHVAGRLPALFASAGFGAVAEHQAFNTIYGTLALFSARKPGG
jgi:ubiquinone/menaquinone biosynthesis C-methylase UbiE